MKKLTDFSADDLKALYKKHGLKPAPGDACVVNGCTCAIGIILVDGGVSYHDTTQTYSEALEQAGVGADDIEVGMFYHGFDYGMDNTGSDDSDDSLAGHGHRLGRAMHAALLAGEFNA